MLYISQTSKKNFNHRVFEMGSGGCNQMSADSSYSRARYWCLAGKGQGRVGG